MTPTLISSLKTLTFIIDKKNFNCTLSQKQLIQLEMTLDNEKFFLISSKERKNFENLGYSF